MAGKKKISVKFQDKKPSSEVAQALPVSMDSYKIEDAARHMERMAEIEMDKPLHKAAVKHLKAKHAAIGKIVKAKIDVTPGNLDELKAERNEKFGQPKEE